MPSTMHDQIKITGKKKLPTGAVLYSVSFFDPYEHEDPVTRKSVNDEIHNYLIPSINDYVKAKGENYKHGEDNHVSRTLFEKSDVLDRWRKDMPTAAALYPLQMPHKKKLADGTEFDEAAERYFPHALDGVGLRSRASIMSYVMYDHFKDFNSSKKPMKWASLASGAAIPVYDAALALDSLGKKIDLLLVDIDPTALKFAKKIALEDYKDISNMETMKLNILRIKKLQKKVGLNSRDAIDILGFFEYLPTHTWNYRKRNIKIQMPGAIEFLKGAYSLLRPGGVLVLGNMRDSHPQLPFTLQIVRWPYIRPRSLKKVMQIINEAGIDSSKVKLYQAGDNVYTVAAITK